MDAPAPLPSPFLLLQLADGAFPSGGFAHSGGLEAGLVLGGRGDVEALLREALWQVGRSALPFARAACEAPSRLAELDEAYDATLSSDVANRASRAQGRALASAAARAFDVEGARAIGAYGKRGPAHHAVVFGALFGALGLGARDASAALLHAAARATLSAAVRLGIVGPLEAQAIQADAAAEMDRVLAECMDVAPEETAQAAPLLELYGALHGLLDGRMFQS